MPVAARRRHNPQARTPAPPGAMSSAHSGRAGWPGRPRDDVVFTFIGDKFSGGPWTSAVQGPKNLKYFWRGWNCCKMLTIKVLWILWPGFWAGWPKKDSNGAKVVGKTQVSRVSPHPGPNSCEDEIQVFFFQPWLVGQRNHEKAFYDHKSGAGRNQACPF